MKKSIILILFVSIIYSPEMLGQCATWVGSADEDDITTAHSVYRGALKAKDFSDVTFDNWKKSFEAAPAADGKRNFHFTDGITIYKEKLKANADDADAKAQIEALYDGLIACYQSGGIKEPKCEDDACRNKRAAIYMGRKAADMYYLLRAPYGKNLEALKAAVKAGGNDTEYTLFRPIADIAVYQFQKEKIDKEEARAIHAMMVEIADHNIANNAQLGTYYEGEKSALNVKFKEIEREIFDCQYFVDKWESGYREDPTPENAKKIFNQLRLQGCDESHPFYSELKASYESWAAQVNADKKAEFEANNPALLANKAYKAGNFQEAINKYNEAIAKETDPSKKAGYHNSVASIYFRKMNDYSSSITNARTAIKLRSDWGKPLLLLGDIYAKKSRSCGDAWKQRLVIIAAIDKYSKAKNVDPSTADEANKKLGIYRASLPDKSEGHMRGVKKGQVINCGCGIGESVSVRFAQ